jgi:hypothetical protein
MAWANCPTHGPIQDARPVLRGGEVSRLECRCGLACTHYEPQSFVPWSELKELAVSHRQPREDHVVPDSPVLAEPLTYEALGGGWFQLSDGRKVRGSARLAAALDDA